MIYCQVCRHHINKKPSWSYKQYHDRKTCSVECQMSLRRGKPLSDDTKKKLSEKLKGRYVSEVVKNNLRTMNIGKKQTKEHIQNTTIARGITEESKMNTKKRNAEYRYFYRLKTVFGISKEKYHEMWEEQGGVCKICKKEYSHRLFLDHCHKTGKVRGLLCRKCNTAIGLANDDPKILFNMITYLQNA